MENKNLKYEMLRSKGEINVNFLGKEKMYF